MHPKQENRMSTSPRPGYVPTGVWKLKGESCNVYLAGTIHILEKNEIPLPSTYYAAYNDSKWLSMETNDFQNPLELMALFASLPKLISIYMDARYQGSDNLQNHVSSDALKLAKKSPVKDAANSEEALKYKPEGLWLQRMAERANNYPGVEKVFSTYAEQDGKKIQQLDSSTIVIKATELLRQIQDNESREAKEMGAEKYIIKNLTTRSVKKNELRRFQLGKLDTNKIHSDLSKYSSQDMATSLLKERNELWMKKILRRLKHEDENGVVMVGAAHLYGEYGLLEMLKKNGYQPVQLYGVEKPNVRN